MSGSNLPSFWNAGIAQNLALDALVRHADAEFLVRFEQHLLVDELLENLVLHLRTLELRRVHRAAHHLHHALAVLVEALAELLLR